MSRKISQETFDDVVRENIEDFDLDQSAALQDAINQFTKQGVDLSNIDLSGGIGRQDILDAIKELDISRKGSDETILAALARITELCNKDHEYQLRNRMFVLNQGGVNTLHILFDVNRSVEVLVQTMILLEDLSKNNVEIRDFFEPGGSERLNNVLKKFSSGGDVNFTVLATTFTLARTVCKSESNKNMLMKSGVGVTITSIITANLSNYTEWTPILTDCCSLMRGLCVHDDLRKDMSCAYENGRFFLKQAGMVHALMTLSSYFKSAPMLASAALSAARNLIATEEAVAVMAQHGAIELIRDILSYPDSPVPLVRSAVGLMRNVCADDVRKDRLVADGSLDLLINVMSQETYAKDAGLMEHAVACLAAISLRSPSNAQRIVNCGTALDILAKNMRRYADRSGLQRQGCLTIRNIAARGPELRPVLLDAGFEDILRAAGRMMDVVDEAYGALRDLNCEVHYVKINAEGKAEPVYEQFGAAAKLQFNPIYDEDVHIVDRVQDEARAPLPLPPQMPTGPTAASATQEEHSGGHDHQHGHSHEHVHGDDCCH